MQTFKSILFAIAFLMAVIEPAQALDQSTDIKGGGDEQLNSLFEHLGTLLRDEFGAKLSYTQNDNKLELNELTKGKLDFLVVEHPISNEDPDNQKFFQFPLVIDAVVPVVNLPDLTSGSGSFTGMTLGNIYLGNITSWGDPALGLPIGPNPDSNLPITIVRQDPESPSSLKLDAYLKLTSPDWIARRGDLTGMGFPDKSEVEDESTVIRKLNETAGSLGYLPFSNRAGSGLKNFALLNYQGRMTTANETSILNGAGRNGWSIGNIIDLKTGDPQQGQWPLIVTYYVIILREHKNAVRARNLIEVFNWYLDKLIMDSNFLQNMIGLPPEVIEIIKTEMKISIISNGMPVMP